MFTSSARAFSAEMCACSYLQAITPIRLPINHIQQLILNLSTTRIASRPVVPRAGALFQLENVLRVVDVAIRARLYALDHPRLEVEKQRAGNVTRVVGLVEEDIFAVAAFDRVVCKVAGLVDAVFLAELLPELGAD